MYPQSTVSRIQKQKKIVNGFWQDQEVDCQKSNAKLLQKHTGPSFNNIMRSSAALICKKNNS